MKRILLLVWVGAFMSVSVWAGEAAVLNHHHFDDAKDSYEQGVLPQDSEIEGWHVGRCYRLGRRFEETAGALLIAEWNSRDELRYGVYYHWGNETAFDHLRPSEERAIQDAWNRAKRSIDPARVENDAFEIVAIDQLLRARKSKGELAVWFNQLGRYRWEAYCLFD